MMSQDLINKYPVAAPRYTSYPTAPHWDAESLTVEAWANSVKTAFDHTNSTEGISLYIHLPYCESLYTDHSYNTRITKSHIVDFPYIQAILKEWDLYLNVFKDKPVIKELHLGGNTPTFFSAEHLHYLITRLLKKATVHEKAEFSFEAHPANTTEDHLQVLYKLGFRSLSLGVHDANFKAYRTPTFGRVEEVVRKARAIGYTSLNFNLMYGLPLQTYEAFSYTLRQVSSLRPDRITFYSYADMLQVRPEQRKYSEEELPSVDEKQRMYELGRALFTHIGYEEIGLEHFVLNSDPLNHAQLRGKLHRNFIGYTHQYTQVMIGLGVSSISDAGTAYTQNVRTIVEYADMVDKGVLPISKGHMLTEEDKMIRQHIQNIMCKGETSWQNDPQFDKLLEDVLPRLSALEYDGLIMVDEEGLKVTCTGKRFLRNICMALDTRLCIQQSANQIFSMAG